MHISRIKKDFIRGHYIAGITNVAYLAEKLDLEAKTIRFYLKEFRVIEQQRPDKLSDYSFFIGKEKVMNMSTELPVCSKSDCILRLTNADK